MKWEELSLKDRADLMKLYIQNGFTGLSKIRSHYNSLDEGGDLGGAKGEVPLLQIILLYQILLKRAFL